MFHPSDVQIPRRCDPPFPIRFCLTLILSLHLRHFENLAGTTLKLDKGTHRIMDTQRRLSPGVSARCRLPGRSHRGWCCVRLLWVNGRPLPRGPRRRVQGQGGGSGRRFLKAASGPILGHRGGRRPHHAALQKARHSQAKQPDFGVGVEWGNTAERELGGQEPLRRPALPPRQAEAGAAEFRTECFFTLGAIRHEK